MLLSKRRMHSPHGTSASQTVRNVNQFLMRAMNPLL
jgi:hypothetical protein